jgi:hypothetical protein
MPRLADLDAPAHIKHVRIQFATIAVRICSYSTRTVGGSVPASKHQQRRRYSYDTNLAQDTL